MENNQMEAFVETVPDKLQKSRSRPVENNDEFKMPSVMTNSPGYPIRTGNDTIKKCHLVLWNKSSKIVNYRIFDNKDKEISSGRFLKWKRIKLRQGEYIVEAWIRKAHAKLTESKDFVLDNKKIPNRDDHLFRAIIVRIQVKRKNQSLSFNDEITVSDILSGII